MKNFSEKIRETIEEKEIYKLDRVKVLSISENINQEFIIYKCLCYK